MGRPKKELKRIHAKKRKKAKGKANQYIKGELPAEKLTQLAKRFVKRRKKKEKIPT